MAVSGGVHGANLSLVIIGRELACVGRGHSVTSVICSLPADVVM
jgi:hypothetical protein